MSESVYEHWLRVRYAETDQMGVAHHASYLVYFEEARTRMMEAWGCSYADCEKAGVGLPVRRLEVRYRSSAFYDDELRVLTRVRDLRAASVTFDYELRRASDDVLVATGWTELACVDLHAAERKVTPLPDSLRELLGRG
ncbi:MAG: acyl-CoA thioesterase [Planctomycetes bacterium]|nr:acyl-CoA thioesterase [Planctomycetota bacterium]MCB9904631.1 acyl-CoA thioesterase [Planctomycetota bacterium]